MCLTIILFVLYVVHTEAICPDVKTADNLNITAFVSGVWTTVARYPNDFETATECLRLKYMLDGDKITIESIDVSEDQHHYFKSFGKVRPDGTMLLSVSTGYPRKTVEVALTIIYVDRNMYAIFYDCIHDEDNGTRDSVWIISRTPSLEGGAKDELFKFIDSSKVVDMNKLMWIHYSDERCNQQ